MCYKLIQTEIGGKYYWNDYRMALGLGMYNLCWLVSSNGCTYHSNLTAHTGNPQPNISTTFIGRSSPEEDLWRQTPRSAEPNIKVIL